jgi:hypothetical protein
MDIDTGLRWIDSELTGEVGKKDRHYRTELGTVLTKKKKGEHDTVTDKLVKAFW